METEGGGVLDVRLGGRGEREGEPRASKQRPSATATAERGRSVRAVYDRGRGRSVRATLDLSPPLLTPQIPTHSATCPRYSSP
eukprot:918044-Rhodomonas_salina.1